MNSIFMFLYTQRCFPNIFSLNRKLESGDSQGVAGYLLRPEIKFKLHGTLELCSSLPRNIILSSPMDAIKDTFQ